MTNTQKDCDMSKANKVIIITGCSSGIGLDAATTLSKRGHRVIATCRKLEDLERLKSLHIESVLMDLNDTNSIHCAFQTINNLTQGRVDALINNAGYGQIGALEDVPSDVLINQFQTNVFGLMELTRLVIPLMRKQKQGRIINISSVLGVISLPLKGAYNASKYAVEGLSDTLRLELKSAGIKVITIEPGPIESLWSNTLTDTFKQIDTQHSVFKDQYEAIRLHATQNKSNSFFTKKASAVTNKLIHAIEATCPRAKYRVTFVAGFLVFLKRILPTKMLDRFLLLVSKFNE